MRAISVTVLVVTLTLAVAAPAFAVTKYFSAAGCQVEVVAEENWGSPYGHVKDNNGACGNLRLEMKWIYRGVCDYLDTGWKDANYVGELVEPPTIYDPDMKRARGWARVGSTNYYTAWVVHASGCA